MWLGQHFCVALPVAIRREEEGESAQLFGIQALINCTDCCSRPPLVSVPAEFSRGTRGTGSLPLRSVPVYDLGLSSLSSGLYHYDPILSPSSRNLTEISDFLPFSELL